MSEPENFDDEEVLFEYENELEFIDSVGWKIYLKQQALSFARQLFCACSVLSFPVFNTLHELLPKETPVRYYFSMYIIEEGKKKKVLDWGRMNFANGISSIGDMAIIASFALIVSTIFLHFLGRKCTVAIANLLHLMVLLYSYKSGFEESYPYDFLLIENFVKEFSIPPYFIYLAEITSPTWRAFFMGLFLFEVDAIQLVISPMLYTGINAMFRDFAVVTSVSLLLALYLPETPFFEILKGDTEKAEETFRWLRAGDTDMLEFNQMVARAENIKENDGITQHLLSPTFILGLIFSLCIMMCSIEVCDFMEAFILDFYVPADVVIDESLTLKIDNFLSASESVDEIIHFYAISLFLVSNFVVPRKIMFFVSYVMGMLIIAVISLKLWSLDVLMPISSVCPIIPAVGLSHLILILPTEIYPAALRHIGVAISAIMNRMYKYMYFLFMESPREGYKKQGVARSISFISYFGSIFGVIFMLMFMPETQNMNIYQLDKLDLRLPFSSRKGSPVVGDSDTGEILGTEKDSESNALESDM